MTLILSAHVGYMEGSSGVRRGAWMEEEDNLLRRCIEKYGEKNWRLVPQRAGLNRCRKSCRFRWLNYLKPNIKRGKFEADEVDLILRLHKLLGNRWTLIAGRLPGRTANDVKNYWRTHLRKKPVFCNKDVKAKAGMTGFVNVIRPRPQTLFTTAMGNSDQPSAGLYCKPLTSPDHHLSPLYDHNESPWWESFLAEISFSGGDPMGNVLEEDEASLSFWNNFPFDNTNNI